VKALVQEGSEDKAVFDQSWQRTGGQDPGKQQARMSMGAVLAVVIAGAFLVILNNSIVNVAVPGLMKIFQATPDQMQWILSGYMLAMGVVIPVTGFLADKWGPRRVYLTGFLIFLAGSVLGALAWNVGILVLSRVVQGIGGGLIMPVSTVILYQVVPRERIGFALGMWGIAAMVAPAVGPTLAGYIVQYYHWSWLFWVNLPVGLLGLGLAQVLLPTPLNLKDTRLDRKGLVLVMIAGFTLLYGLGQGHVLGWNSPVILVMLATALVSGVLFVLVELKEQDPLLDLGNFKVIPFAMSGVIVSVGSMGLFVVLYLIPVFLQVVQNRTPVETGILLVPAALATAVTMPVAGKIFDMMGGKLVVGIGLIITTWSTWELGKLALDTGYYFTMGWLAVRGVGLGFSLMPATSAGLNALSPAGISRASAIINTLRQVSAALGIAIFTLIYQQRQVAYLAQFTQQEAAAKAIGDAFIVMAVLSALTIPLAYCLGDHRVKKTI
jgi:EmrB/QacA subfamily drug resistance transporter